MALAFTIGTPEVAGKRHALSFRNSTQHRAAVGIEHGAVDEACRSRNGGRERVRIRLERVSLCFHLHDHAKTAPVVISEMMGSLTGVNWGLVFAAASVQLVPLVAFVILVQKYLIAGLTAGSIKG